MWVPSVGGRVAYAGRCTALSPQRGSCFWPVVVPPHDGETWQPDQPTSPNPIGHMQYTSIVIATKQIIQVL